MPEFQFPHTLTRQDQRRLGYLTTKKNQIQQELDEILDDAQFSINTAKLAKINNEIVEIGIGASAAYNLNEALKEAAPEEYASIIATHIMWFRWGFGRH